MNHTTRANVTLIGQTRHGDGSKESFVYVGRWYTGKLTEFKDGTCRFFGFQIVAPHDDKNEPMCADYMSFASFLASLNASYR